jgi:hypothetical protein
LPLSAASLAAAGLVLPEGAGAGGATGFGEAAALWSLPAFSDGEVGFAVETV